MPARPAPTIATRAVEAARAALESTPRTGKCHAGRGRLGKQPAAGEAPLLGVLAFELASPLLYLEPFAPLTGDFFERKAAPIRLGMGGDQLSEASRERE